MSQTPAAAPELEGRMFLFRKPELLTKEQHGNLGVARPERPFTFCEAARAIPITISEIPMVQKHYPVIFADEKNPLPMAVVGLIDDINLFVGDNGEWAEHCYIPGYVRRYPFALAGDKNSDRMAIIVDAEYEGLTDKPEIKFFDGDEPSEDTRKAMEYCSNYERDRQTTFQFAQKLAEFDIIRSQVAQFTPEGGEAKPFAQYFGVEENLLAGLPNDKFQELRETNILPILYAQLMSMGNWRVMMERRIQRHGLSQDQFLEPVTKQ